MSEKHNNPGKGKLGKLKVNKTTAKDLTAKGDQSSKVKGGARPPIHITNTCNNCSFGCTIGCTFVSIIYCPK
jgi:hypothetical protein